MIGLTQTTSQAARPNGTAPVPAPAHELTPYYEALLRQLRETEVHTLRPLQAIGLTSCARGEGVSTVAANLALCAARSGFGPVLLVDAHVQRPAVDRFFRCNRSPGLLDALQSPSDPWDCVQASGVEHLSLIAAGADGATPACDFQRLTDLLDTLKDDFRLILFDLPPAEDLSPSCALAGRLDGVLLGVEAERVREPVAQRTKARLQEAQANVLGVVFNKRRKYLPDWLYRKL